MMKPQSSKHFIAVIITYTEPAQAVTVCLKVAFNCNLPPYQFLDDNGTLAGMHIDIMN